MARQSVPPRPMQERSRESLRRMLDAAEVVLAKYGLQGTTLPRIAKRAGISPSHVYRRFRDKDALMAAVFERIRKRSAADTTAQFDPETVRHLGLSHFSRKVIEGMIRNFRTDAGLSRAAVEYSEQHWDAAFVRKTRASEAQSFETMVKILMMWREQIKHPNPERAIRFAFIMVGVALREMILFNRMQTFQGILPLDDETLSEELPRMFLAYLGVELS